MTRATFPFYLGEKAGDSSICLAVILKVATELIPKFILEPEKEALSFENIHGIFFKTIKEHLEENFSEISNDICNDILQNTNNPIDKTTGKDMSQILISIKNNILSEAPIATEDVNLLHDYLFLEKDNNHSKCMGLLPWLGLDPEALADCFSNLASAENRLKIVKCFKAIATNGIRWYTNASIEERGGAFPMLAIQNIRAYTERLCIYINIASVLSNKNDELYQFDLITASLLAAYFDGKITREKELYSKESFKAMHSRGASEASGPTSEQKNKRFDALKGFVNDEYEKGSMLSTKQMTELVMSRSEFKGLSLDRVKRTITSVKKQYGLDDRKNNRIADPKRKEGSGD